MRRWEAFCHAVTLGLALLATAASGYALLRHGVMLPTVLIMAANVVLLAVVVARLWLALRRQGDTTRRAIASAVVLAASAAIIALGWAVVAHFVVPWPATVADAQGVAHGTLYLGLAAIIVATTLLAQALQWRLPRVSRRWRQASAILALLALVSALLAAFLCLVVRNVFDLVPLLAIVAFAALALRLICEAGLDTWPANVFVLPVNTVVRARHSGVAGFIVLALILVGLLLAVGYYYVDREASQARRVAHADLATVADLKVQSIAAWYQSHVLTAQLLLDPSVARVEIQALLQGSSSPQQHADVTQWLRSMARANGYASVSLIDPHGAVRLSTGTALPATAPVLRDLEHALRAHRVRIDDLYRDPLTGGIALDLAVPLRLSSSTSERADCVLVLRIDPSQYLYPMVQSWPMPSASAESLLVRKDGDAVLYLNELRHRSGAALTLRLPLSGKLGVPALLAVTRDSPLAEGLDYRGEPVLAAVRRVANTPWFLVAKVDRAEIYAPVRARVALLSALIGVLALAALLGAAILWRQRSYSAVWRELELQRENTLTEQRYRRLVENISDALMIDDVHGHVRYVNDRFLALYGYTRDEVIGRHFSEFSAPQWRDLGRHRHRQRMAGEAVVDTFEYQALRKDGSQFWAEVHVSTVVEDGRLIGTQSTVQDITERKRAQALQAALLHISEAAHAASDMDDLYRRIHQIISGLLPAQNFYVALYDGVTDIVSFPYFIDGHDPPPEPQRLDEISLTAVVLRSGKSMLLHPNTPHDAEKFGSVMVGTAPVEWLGVPMQVQSRTIGVLAVQSYDPAIRFSESDKALLQFVSTQVAAAIERKRTAAAMRDSEEKFRAVFEESPNAIGLFAIPGGRLVEANKAARDVFALPHEQLLGKTAIELGIWTDAAERQTYLATLHANGSVRDFETTLHRHDGDIVPVLYSGAMVSIAGHDYALSVMQDISARKRAEQWQRHYADILALIMAEAPVADVLQRIAHFAEQQSETAGVLIQWQHGPTQQEVRGGKAQASMIEPDAGGGLPPAAWASHVSEPIITADQQILGSLVLFPMHAVAAQTGQVTLLRQSAALAALAIERARQQSDQRLAKVVFEQTLEAIMVSDQDDRIVMVNPAFETLTGYGADTVIDKTPRMLESGRQQPEFYQRIEESVAREDCWQGEFWCRHRDGDSRPMLLSVVVVRDARGAISQRIRVMADISEQKFQAARIEQLAFYDSLTGLPNRALFLDRLEHCLDAARRHHLNGALLFLDLDRFKEINDSQGHAVGDLALVEVARRLQRLMRKEETLARLGGDEFVLIAEGANQDTAATIAERILSAVRAPMQVSDQVTHLSGSIGIALYPDDGDSVGELIKHADIAMYRAKAMTGGYRFYQASMGAALQERLGLARRLELAITQGQLQLHYQPRVALASEGLHGAEALLRWHDDEFGDVAPAQFIPIAEERGLIGPLGDWVMAEACRQMAQWQAQGLYLPGTLAVNLSTLQLHLPDMVDKLLACIDAAGLRTNSFELELTESSMMADPAAAITILDQLHGAGFSLAIDDFGTGYSSLVYLKRFAVDNIKIDMSFVSDMLTDRNDAAIVATIVAMSRSLGLRTTAEGVENPEQAEALLQLGCDFAQGFHFGCPEPADVFARHWLRRA